jgi:hypothetical protein
MRVLYRALSRYEMLGQHLSRHGHDLLTGEGPEPSQCIQALAELSAKRGGVRVPEAALPFDRETGEGRRI